jgi:cytochrome c6
MKKILVLLSLPAIALFLFGAPVVAKGKEKTSGKELFEKNCSPCHPNGSNIVNPDFTLHKKDRERHGVKTASDIMRKMRNPGPGMTRFDKKTIPDDQAKEIAGYIIKTFK